MIKRLTVHEFRCFQARSFQFEKNISIIQGDNGTGKSSILEALHYGCYLKSFRTHLNRELVRTGGDHLVIKIELESPATDLTTTITVSIADDHKKEVRINGKAIDTYQELIDEYRVVTITAEDLDIIQGAPEHRRNFINHAISLYSKDYRMALKKLSKILQQRNALLANAQFNSSSRDEMMPWTEALYHVSSEIQTYRTHYLERLNQEVKYFLSEFFQDDDLLISLHYQPKEPGTEPFSLFWQRWIDKIAHEKILKHSLFGAHLDDIVIRWSSHKARNFASRGQQKLIMLLIKIAQLRVLYAQTPTSSSGALLIDDFMTDFDDKRIAKVYQLIQQLAVACPIHIIITAPQTHRLDTMMHDENCEFVNI